MTNILISFTRDKSKHFYICQWSRFKRLNTDINSSTASIQKKTDTKRFDSTYTQSTRICHQRIQKRPAGPLILILKQHSMGRPAVRVCMGLAHTQRSRTYYEAESKGKFLVDQRTETVRFQRRGRGEHRGLRAIARARPRAQHEPSGWEARRVPGRSQTRPRPTDSEAGAGETPACASRPKQITPRLINKTRRTGRLYMQMWSDQPCNVWM